MCKPLPSVPKYTLKDIFDLYWSDYQRNPNRKFHLSDFHLHVINTIRCCQTARLGLYTFSCTNCGDTHALPRSCKHRFCNRCGTADTMDWVGNLSLKLPDIKHHHVVFSVPFELRELCRQNKIEFYNLLFKSSQEVVQDLFWRAHSLQAGIISVLHTNGADLKYHPHVHMIVSSGGITKSGEIKELELDYLYPQRKLANEFRTVFLNRLYSLIKQGRIKIFKTSQDRWQKVISRLSKKQWICSIEKPLKGVEKIVAYVGRYTKKSCLSERRILSIENGMITISYKDYKNSDRSGKPKDSLIRMSYCEFLDRLMEHIPEKGFKVVRYYGLYAGVNLGKIPKRLKIKTLNVESYDLEDMEDEEIDLCPFKKYRRQVFARTGKDPLYCYGCHQTMKLIEVKYVDKNGHEKYIDIFDSG